MLKKLAQIKEVGIANKNAILCGDCARILKSFDDSSVDLVITSPPYFQQRDYGNDEFGIGNEEDENCYLNKLTEIFAECVRVTKDDGAIVFNLGDKYINGGLSLIPYKFAIQVIEKTDVSLINQITWAKLNPTPRQEKRKLIQATEPFFVFVKSKNYHFDLDNFLGHLDLLNKNTSGKPTENLGKKYIELLEISDLSEFEKANAKIALEKVVREVHNSEIVGFRMKVRGVHKLAYGGQNGGRNDQIKNNGFTIIRILGNRMKKDIIESPVEITKDNEHPAVFPNYIIQELIKLLSRENDLILDPFCGSGTTCVVAKALNRNYLGIEINAKYVDLANKRLMKDEFQPMLFL